MLLFVFVSLLSSSGVCKLKSARRGARCSLHSYGAMFAAAAAARAAAAAAAATPIKQRGGSGMPQFCESGDA